MNLNGDALHEHATTRENSARKQAASDELHVARERLHLEFNGLVRAVKRAWFVERKVLGLVVFDTALKAAGGVAVGLAALMTVLVATWLVLTSLRSALQIWTEGAWWSDLVLGVLLLGVVAAAAFAVRRYVHRSTLAATRSALNTESLAANPTAPGSAA